MWRWNLNEVHCISRLTKISVFSTSEEWPIFRMKDVGMEFSGWLPGNLIGPWVLSPCRRQPVLHFLPSWSLPYHFLLLTGSPASILPRFSVPPPFPFFCATLLLWSLQKSLQGSLLVLTGIILKGYFMTGPNPMASLEQIWRYRRILRRCLLCVPIIHLYFFLA